jgi:hypothetical protein
MYRSFLSVNPIRIVALIAMLGGSFLITGCGILRTPAELEARAKGTLRSFGSAELAYWGSNGTYGTFEDLVEVGDIAEGYTLENMIEGYTMTLAVWHDPDGYFMRWDRETGQIEATGQDDPSVMNCFEIIAYPTIWRGVMDIYAITEDQVVRHYVPEDGNEWGDVKTWYPVL